ncbi:alpha/beta fold hydrolase [Clostridium estertheticum]|uniref:Alpha/beta hydrolase n=1 Tax=Clostridium estertheticum TaxID=238834 RepID=A0A7Y3SX40_9CLOT|nr:alpha/beta hydrolase [Clostridium estertheticum]MBW9172464.1 alpha/beta hydrolase [Clostridium estertheticum]NNU76645.1 alpha/beta hydrolase [Clostridium estertheticum]WBL45384.1 alpha/beta hydrolase [Clostridium estertheticum]WLC73466.1 alpha/beta hydrolase [Clostridium estertheticum]
MKFYEYGDKSSPHIMLIHGAGRSYWLYLREARLLQNKYHVILPVIDGHGEEGNVPYISTEKIVDQLIEYIDKNCDGKLFAVSGVSLGGQITIELLSRRRDIAKKAIVESGLCIPQPFLLKCSVFVMKLCGKWLFSKTFNKWALKRLPKRMQYPKEITELYMRDITSIKTENLNRIFDTYYQYELKESLKDSQADTIYWYGSKEMKCIKQSAKLFQSYMKKCKVVELKGYYHSEISDYHPEEWVKKAEEFFNYR